MNSLSVCILAILKGDSDMVKKISFHILWVDDDVDEIRYLLYPLEQEGSVL